MEKLVTPAAAPDWSLVHFDVGCARCGHDLRGRKEPVCPACGLAFDWSEAVPIKELTCSQCGYHLYGLSETRCPECGSTFDWNQALSDFHRRRKPLFEYHYRQRPIGSFLWSLWYAKFPRRLWRILDLHDPPSVRGLRWMLAIAGALFFVLPIGLSYLGGWLLQLLRVATMPGAGFTRSRFLFGAVHSIGPWAVGSSVPRGLGFIFWMRMLAFYAAWALAGYAALLLLRQSMARCRVRNAHVLRAYAYTFLPLSVLPAAYCLAAFAVDAWSFFSYVQPLATFVQSLLGIAPCAISLWTAYCLRCAYRHYIRMPHAWAVALATQGVAVMCGLLAMLEIAAP
ncbi:MAG: hypothetical protein HY763_13020 [Planctomycetes bacterium]|nr:hypothetical protein [Planctomycetota bacterium]